MKITIIKSKFTRAVAKSSLLALFILSLSGNALSQEIAVIVSPAVDSADIGEKEIELIYTGKSTKLIPYDLPDSQIKESFYKILTGRSMAQINALRARLVFGGRGEAPETLISAKAVKHMVRNSLRGIGYIDKTLVDDSVQVILILNPEN